MPRAFSQIAYTPSVKAAQARYGARGANVFFERDTEARNTLTDEDRRFIEAIDTFFMATVGENGWPYVQHRGGPTGFLKVLDARTIGFADFAGNRQYISTGNLSSSDKVALILMDFANRRRLKIWGRARLVHEDSEPERIAQLEVPTYRAQVERGFVIQIEALDFNCPQHIKTRFTEDEFLARSRPALDELKALRQVAEKQDKESTAPYELGSGELELTITAVKQLTPRVRAYELRRFDGSLLPAITAGAHLRLPIRLSEEKIDTRSYSITSSPRQRDMYEIAVLREESGKGGSIAVHRDYSLGTVLRCSVPANAFPLHNDHRPAVLIAGGIGITPLKAMAHELKERGTEFAIHYAARSRREMAYWSDLQYLFHNTAHFYFTDSPVSERLKVSETLESAPENAVFYVCGPARLIEAVLATAEKLHIARDRVRFERFLPPGGGINSPVLVTLARSNKKVTVSGSQSILDALLEADIEAPYSCKTGTCGTCAAKVLSGEVDHRDAVLTEEERDNAALMCTCVSRAKSPHLTLDL